MAEYSKSPALLTSWLAAMCFLFQNLKIPKSPLTPSTPETNFLSHSMPDGPDGGRRLWSIRNNTWWRSAVYFNIQLDCLTTFSLSLFIIDRKRVQPGWEHCCSHLYRAVGWLLGWKASPVPRTTGGWVNCLHQLLQRRAHLQSMFIHELCWTCWSFNYNSRCLKLPNHKCQRHHCIQWIQGHLVQPGDIVLCKPCYIILGTVTGKKEQERVRKRSDSAVQTEKVDSMICSLSTDRRCGLRFQPCGHQWSYSTETSTCQGSACCQSHPSPLQLVQLQQWRLLHRWPWRCKDKRLYTILPKVFHYHSLYLIVLSPHQSTLF